MITKKQNYRKLFKEYYQIDFDNNYEVHHINLQHEDNRIENLMLLPKKLHKEYHKALNEIKMIEQSELNLFIRGVLDGGNGYNFFILQTLKNFVTVYDECQKWKDYLDYLKGLIPNIHGLKIDGNI